MKHMKMSNRENITEQRKRNWPFWRQSPLHYRPDSGHCLVSSLSYVPSWWCLLVTHTCQPQCMYLLSCLIKTALRWPERSRMVIGLEAMLCSQCCSDSTKVFKDTAFTNFGDMSLISSELVMISHSPWLNTLLRSPHPPVTLRMDQMICLVVSWNPVSRDTCTAMKKHPQNYIVVCKSIMWTSLESEVHTWTIPVSSF